MILRNQDSSVSEIGNLLVGVSIINIVDRLFEPSRQPASGPASSLLGNPQPD
jgi:hypothetical protein